MKKILTIKDIQALSLEILLDVHDFCEKNGIIYIKFHASDLIEQLKKCNEIKISIVGKPNINEWMGNKSP